METAHRPENHPIGHGDGRPENPAQLRMGGPGPPPLRHTQYKVYVREGIVRFGRLRKKTGYTV